MRSYECLQKGIDPERKEVASEETMEEVVA